MRTKTENRKQKNKYINTVNNHRTAAMPRRLNETSPSYRNTSQFEQPHDSQAAHKQHELPIYQRLAQEKNTIKHFGVALLLVYSVVSFVYSILPEWAAREQLLLEPKHGEHLNRTTFTTRMLTCSRLRHYCQNPKCQHAHNSAAQPM